VQTAQQQVQQLDLAAQAAMVSHQASHLHRLLTQAAAAVQVVQHQAVKVLALVVRVAVVLVEQTLLV
jgi:hypothetical protein